MALQATLEGGASDFNCNYLNIWHCRVGQTNVQDGAGDFHYIHKLHFRVGQAKLEGGTGDFNCYYLNTWHFSAGQTNLQGRGRRCYLYK
jgi:hypothetical protein